MWCQHGKYNKLVSNFCSKITAVPSVHPKLEFVVSQHKAAIDSQGEA